MTEPVLLRVGDSGESVRELQVRLRAAGFAATADATYDAATEQLVRDFQTARGLRVDGICGPDTWGALVESGFQLGDRLLYLKMPMLRGDDVASLQHRLNGLGFDAGREDGILGNDTERAIRQFQRNAGIATDGVAGPATIAAIDRLGGLAAGSVASVRERETLRRDTRRLVDRGLFVIADPGLEMLGVEVARGLREWGAVVALDTSGTADTTLADEANRFRADVCVTLGSGMGAETDARCVYFANSRFRSEAGFRLAQSLTDSLRTVLPVTAPQGRTYPILRETRMAAVVCELFARNAAAGATGLTAKTAELAQAIVEGIRVGVETPIDVTG